MVTEDTSVTKSVYTSVEYVQLHEVVESASVFSRLNSGETFAVLEQECSFDEALSLLVQIPLLQVVYDCDVIDISFWFKAVLLP